MFKIRIQDNFVATVTVAAIILVVLLALLAFVRGQVRMNDPARPQFTFAQFGPYQINTLNYAITASLAVQISRDDESWAEENKKSLNIVFKKVLLDVGDSAVKGPNGQAMLQDALARGSNATFGGNHVQAVLLTDFVFQKLE